MEKRKIFGNLLERIRMRFLAFIITLFSFAFLYPQKASATHLIGGYMSYEFLEKVNNEYQYKVSLYMFRDKEQSTVDFDDEILLGVYLNNDELNRIQVSRVKLLSRKIVRPPGNEECEYYANNEIEMAFYEKVISLPARTEGYHITFVRCCRNIQDNLINDQGKPFQGQTYYCFIPNPALRNSSPRFSGVPSPYMCEKDTNTFLNRAVDIDGDSLVYRFVWPWQGGEPTQGGAIPDPPVKLELPIESVQYRTGYDYTRPFGSNGIAKINANNGLTTLLAPSAGSYVVAIEVSEYRNGILLSTVRLDMQILVLRCPPNNKPVAKSPEGLYFEVEAGDQLCFRTEGVNNDNEPQDVTLFATGDILTGENGVKPPLATMETKVGTDFVSSEFCWTPSCDQARKDPYLITITARDNGCPPKEDLINVEIKVLKFIGSKEILGPDKACSGSAIPTSYSAKNPSTGSSFFWEVKGGNIVGVKNQKDVNIVWTGSGQGTIRMVEISRFGCPGDTIKKTVTLLDAPKKPIISGKDTVCLNDANVAYSVPQNSGSKYNWFLPDGTTTINGGNIRNYSWPALGNFEIKVVEINSDGCASDTGVFKVNVRKPAPGIIGPRSVCPNSTNVVYNALGLSGSVFNWNIIGGTQTGGGSSSKAIVNWGNEGIGRVEVQETDKFGCVSDVIRYAVNKTYDLAGALPNGDTSVCEFDALVDYWVVKANGSVYRWDISGGSQVSGDSTSEIEVTWGATGAGRVGVQEWAYDAVNDRECVSPFRYINVDINPIPTADEIDGDFEVCQSGDEWEYTVKGFAGSTYEWTINGSSDDIDGQGTNTIRYVWDLPGSFVVTVRELSKDSCPGQMIDTTMIVHPKPTSDEIVGDRVLCFPNHTNVSYFISGFDNSSYQWWIDNGTYPGGDTSRITIDWAESGYGKIRALEISEYGCVGDTLELDVYINNLELDLKVISVGFPDNRIHGSWTTRYDDLITGTYEIEKRVAGSEGVWTSVKNEVNKSFLETGINTDLNAFEYRIKAVDLCGNVRYSEVHTNILLTGIQDETDFSLILDFSPYLGWDNGVNSYELFKSVNSDQFMRFDQVVSPDQKVFVGGNSDNYRQCFRVKAYEQDGGNQFSWSNEICFFFQPDVYVPTAFTPNKDGVNDSFHPVSVAVNDYKLSVYNRWGELVFQTLDKDDRWNGKYNDVDAPAGIYMYIVEFSDYRNEVYTKNGTVQLMR